MNHLRLHRAAPLAALLLVLATHSAAQAADRGFYLGLAYSSVSPDYAPPEMVAWPTVAADSLGDTPSRVTGGLLDSIGSQGFKPIVGYRVLDWLAFEADYLDLSSDSAAMVFVCIDQPCPSKARAETSSTSLSALAMSPVGKLDLFARLGVSRRKSTIDTLNDDGSRFWSQDFSGTDEKYGVGGQVHIDKVTARLEYEHLRFGGDAADTWSVGIAWAF